MGQVSSSPSEAQQCFRHYPLVLYPMEPKPGGFCSEPGPSLAGALC